MAIGLACGSMNFILAIAAFLLILVAVVVLRKLEAAVKLRNPAFLVVCDKDKPVLTGLLDYAHSINAQVIRLTSDLSVDGKSLEMTFRLKLHNLDFHPSDFLAHAQMMEGVKSAQMIGQDD